MSPHECRFLEPYKPQFHGEGARKCKRFDKRCGRAFKACEYAERKEDAK